MIRQESITQTVRGQFMTVHCFALGVPGITKGGCSDPGLNHNSRPHGIVKTMESILKDWVLPRTHLAARPLLPEPPLQFIACARRQHSLPLANTQSRGPSLQHSSTPLLLLHVSVEDGVTCVHTQGADRSKLRLDPLHDVGNLAHLTRLRPRPGASDS